MAQLPHAGQGAHLASSAWMAWTAWDLTVATALLAAGTLYLIGIGRLWRRAGWGRGIRVGEAGAFVGAWLTLAVALVSPIDTLSGLYFSVHMTQHELLMLVAAPLLVLGRPLVALTWVLPGAARAALPRWRTAALRRLWSHLTAPVFVLILHAVAVWAWHLPVLFEAALRSEAVHAVQHLGFFWTAALFWWALAHGRYGRLGYGVDVVFVFLTAVHQSVLGALITFAESAWYPTYAVRSPQVDPMRDQQLAGLLMWVPSGAIFLVIGGALFVAWLGEAERRSALRGSVAP